MCRHGATSKESPVATGRNSGFLCRFLQSLQGKLLTSESCQPERTHRVNLLETSIHQSAQGNMTRHRVRKMLVQRLGAGRRRGQVTLSLRVSPTGVPVVTVTEGSCPHVGRQRELRGKANGCVFSSHRTRAFSTARNNPASVSSSGTLAAQPGSSPPHCEVAEQPF